MHSGASIGSRGPHVQPIELSRFFSHLSKVKNHNKRNASVVGAINVIIWLVFFVRTLLPTLPVGMFSIDFLLSTANAKVASRAGFG